MVPVAIQSFVGTMEIVESAAAGGDHYSIREAMIVDGLGTCIGALFGSALPTTVHVGHKRHKTIGARAGYSISNAAAFLVLFMSGVFPALVQLVDQASLSLPHASLSHTQVSLSHKSLSHTSLSHTQVSLTHKSLSHTSLSLTQVSLTHKSLSPTCHTAISPIHPPDAFLSQFGPSR